MKMPTTKALIDSSMQDQSSHSSTFCSSLSERDLSTMGAGVCGWRGEEGRGSVGVGRRPGEDLWVVGERV